MLKVYAARWCPHCIRTIEYLKLNGIDFDYIDIEKQTRYIVEKIVEVNGGADWVVPTLEYNGRWREGKAFDEMELAADLRELGLEFS
jgi:mycoredoxin